jgi:hypothetical protein
MSKEKTEVRERLGFHELMDVLGVWSADLFSEEYHHEVVVERGENHYSVWVKDNGDGTYDLDGAAWVFEPIDNR